jgi:hypothetical protein
MTAPFGGSIRDEISLDREEIKVVLFALDDAIATSAGTHFGSVGHGHLTSSGGGGLELQAV